MQTRVSVSATHDAVSSHRWEAEAQRTPPYASPTDIVLPPLRSDSRLPSPMQPEKRNDLALPVCLEPTPHFDTHQYAFACFSRHLYPLHPPRLPWLRPVSSPDTVGDGCRDLPPHTDLHRLNPGRANAGSEFASAAPCSLSPTLPETTITSVTALDQRTFLAKDAHIKRPRNAWIHFRCHYGQALKNKDATLRAEDISRRASKLWAEMNEQEKKPWHDLAEQEKLAHKEAFPEYRYCPKRTPISHADGPRVDSDTDRWKRTKRQSTS